MTPDQRFDEIDALALRHYPTPFESWKRQDFTIRQLKEMVRGYDFREKNLCQLRVVEPEGLGTDGPIRLCLVQGGEPGNVPTTDLPVREVDSGIPGNDSGPVGVA